MKGNKVSAATALGIVRKYFPSVTEVHDADDNVILEVTRDDSSEGTVKDHSHCAMARACQRKFKARGVIVSVTTVYIIQKDGATRYRLPESVSREIVSFDREAGFAEGQYELIKPSKSQRIGQRQGSNKDPRNRKPSGKPHFMHYTVGIRAMLRSGELVKPVDKSAKV